MIIFNKHIKTNNIQMDKTKLKLKSKTLKGVLGFWGFGVLGLGLRGPRTLALALRFRV